MDQLKSSDFMNKDTIVYGCGVERKTEQGYHKGVTFDQSGIQLSGKNKTNPFLGLQAEKESSK